MKLASDEFVVSYDADRVSISDILKVCEETGFPATVSVEKPREELTRQAASDDLPQFYVDAINRARQEEKPILLDFGAKWCVPCQRMEKLTLVAPEVAELLKQLVVIKIDADDYPNLIAKYKVSGLPDLRLLSHDGTELKRFLDFQEAASFSEELKTILASEN